MRKIKIIVLFLFCVFIITGCKSESTEEEELNVKFFNGSNYFTLLIDEDNNPTKDILVNKGFITTKKINTDDVKVSLNSDYLNVREYRVYRGLGSENKEISDYKGYYYYTVAYNLDIIVPENLSDVQTLSLTGAETIIKIENNSYKQTLDDFEITLIPETTHLQLNDISDLKFWAGPIGNSYAYGIELLHLSESYIYEGRTENLIITGGGILNDHLKKNKLYIQGEELTDVYQPEYKEHIHFTFIFEFEENEIPLNNTGYASYYIDYEVDGTPYRSYGTNTIYYRLDKNWMIDQWIESGAEYDEFY